MGAFLLSLGGGLVTAIIFLVTWVLLSHFTRLAVVQSWLRRRQSLNPGQGAGSLAHLRKLLGKLSAEVDLMLAEILQEAGYPYNLRPAHLKQVFSGWPLTVFLILWAGVYRFDFKGLYFSLLSALALPVGVYLWLKTAARNRQARLLEEMGLMLEILEVYSRGGSTLYEALQACLPVVQELRPALEHCLMRWGAGPEVAMREMVSRIKHPEAEGMAAVLIQVVQYDPRQAAVFLEGEYRRLEAVREEQVNQSIQRRPVYFTLYLVFPGLALLSLLMGPFAANIIKQLKTF